MRFKASLRVDTLPVLLDATASLARVTRGWGGGGSGAGGGGGGISSSSRSSCCCSCYMKLTPTEFFLNVRHAGALEAYVEADATAFFYGGFTIESKRNNSIALLLDVQHLHDALRLAAQCSRITMKLTKRQNQGVLSFEFTDALMDNLWITQDCPVQPLQGEEVDNAGTPSIPACEWNVEAPRLRLALGALARMRRLRAEEVLLDVDTTFEREGFCTVSFSGASDLVQLRTSFPGCSLLVADEACSKSPSKPRVARTFKTRRLAAALKLALEVNHGKASEGLVACIIPEDESAHPWACILFHSAKLESLKLFCVLPTVRPASRSAALE